MVILLPRHGSLTTVHSSHLHDIRFLGVHRVVDLLDGTVGELLDLLFVVLQVVLRDLSVLLELLHAVHAIPASGADADTSFLRHLLDAFYQVATAFLGKRWNREADDLAIDRRIDAELRLLDRPLDVLRRAE